MIKTMMHNPAHPGELLQGWLADLKLGMEAAYYLGVDRATFSSFLGGHSSISADFDLRLSEFLGTPPGYWLSMQMTWDIWEAKELAEKRQKIQRFANAGSYTMKDTVYSEYLAALEKAIDEGNANRIDDLLNQKPINTHLLLELVKIIKEPSYRKSQQAAANARHVVNKETREFASEYWHSSAYRYKTRGLGSKRTQSGC